MNENKMIHVFNCKSGEKIFDDANFLRIPVNEDYIQLNGKEYLVAKVVLIEGYGANIYVL